MDRGPPLHLEQGVVRIRIVSLAEVERGSTLDPCRTNSLLAADYVGDPKGVKKDIARIELQQKKLEGRRRALLVQLDAHSAVSPDIED